MKRNSPLRNDVLGRPEVRWTVGILIGLAATTGMLIFVLLVAIALEPPAWLQVVLGVALVAGGGILTWLVATALGRLDAADPPSDPSTTRLDTYERRSR